MYLSVSPLVDDPICQQDLCVCLPCHRHVQGSAAAEQAAAQRADSLASSVEGLASNLEALEQEAKKVKRHVAKAYQQIEVRGGLVSMLVAQQACVWPACAWTWACTLLKHGKCIQKCV